jgi:hypothetical protein
VDRLDADGTRVSGQESTSPPIFTPLKNTPFGADAEMPMPRDFRPKSDNRRNTIIIMRATLHDPVPNTYCGQ